MKKVAIFSALLLLGLALSQLLPTLVGPELLGPLGAVFEALTMWMLAFIMIHVGYEFHIDKRNLRQYGWDYVVAMTAAAFPWIFVALYFLAVMLPDGSLTSWEAWKETLLTARFAAPTSAGVLFAMLAAAGLSATWVFRKTRILAIFDDLDTVLLMIPLKMLMVGVAWQLGGVVLVMVALLWIAWRYLHRIRIPVSWPWVLGYAAVITAASELVYYGSKLLDDSVPIHVEVLLPAFVLGCVMAVPAGSDPHRDDDREGHQEGPESVQEQRVSTVVSALFMVLVGLSMPSLFNVGAGAGSGSSSHGEVGGWGWIAAHVVAVTVIANAGKMFPLVCYRKEASWRERLAVCIAMWPRGEVGAGVLLVSLAYGIGGPILTVAMLSLALNIALTGLFVLCVKRLILVGEAAEADGATAPAALGVSGAHP
ncbi:MAG: sodium:proton antiporter [Thermoanaerobaculia bacterium]|nr:sodium:proton antiporter [Thermoanaerobaculia bacterium]